MIQLVVISPLHYLKQLSLPLGKSSVTSEFTPCFTGGKTSRVNLQSGTFHLLTVNPTVN